MAIDWQRQRETPKQCLFCARFQVLRADIAQDLQSRRSKGYGTILYERQEDADTAIRELNSTEYEGRIISVRLDRYA